MRYCSQCGSSISYRIPPGDSLPRYICDQCRTIHYENPKMVVGCIPEWNERILFCRRAIEPQYGKWTIPAGFLEKGETLAAAAKRETFEEAGAVLAALEPFALFDLVFVGQIYLIFRSGLKDPGFKAGDESLEVRFFREEEVPWKDLAFPVIRKSLRLYFKDRAKGDFSFHTGEIKFKNL